MIVIIGAVAAIPTSPSTRERLLAAAIDVFVEQGYEGARVQDIARAAGLTTGAIYANFRGKNELLFDAIGARADTEIEAMLSEAQRRDLRDMFEFLGDRLMEPRETPPLLIDAIAAARRDPELAGALRHRLDAREAAIVELVERAKREVTADIDSAVMARFCMTLAMGALVMRTLQTAPPERDAWHELISRLLDAVFQEATAQRPEGSGARSRPIVEEDSE
jgi:AcrR family transcriptional regulator